MLERLCRFHHGWVIIVLHLLLIGMLSIPVPVSMGSSLITRAIASKIYTIPLGTLPFLWITIK